ncbi:hypothetical protein [Jannaschia aquimarina]|uniref:Uncharacterized protein n=1 Tax=Jannaschia aquimarina TaxID=935700 RepID=A0A0D1CM94_9RHOB|nr:hypothetical protein [Jannaschia aquimarina]KIT15872.1 hypothetical protein jaqu_24520 [Jannaschia aquimarina]SNT10483.1 hypothetical protein SAMN05421775_105268 [Jannaschia aquimarina]
MKTISALVPKAIVVGFGLTAAAIWLPKSGPAPVDLDGPVTDLSYDVRQAETRLAELARHAAERPLFQASRRPEQASTPAPPPPAPTLILVGVLSDADSRMALVRLSNAPTLYRLAAGTTFGPWSILSIGPDTIRVSKDDAPPFEMRIRR